MFSQLVELKDGRYLYDVGNLHSFFEVLKFNTCHLQLMGQC